MNEITDTLLHRFLDDDLSEEEVAALEAHLASSPNDALKLEALTEMRAAINGSIEARAEAFDSDALFARIEADLASVTAAPAVASPASNVIPFRRRMAPIVVVGTLAAAAAILLFVRTTTDGGEQARARNERIPTAVAHGGSEIEEVTFGENSIGTVFEVPSQNGERLAVVWISDE